MKRIIIHWTAGNWDPSLSDLRAYHFVIDGKGEVVDGVPVDRNRAPLGAGYAAHTLNCNSDSIGVSLACMRGAVESPFNAGDRPMTEEQFNAMIVLVRDLARKYGIAVTRETIMTHAEVQKNLGITQRAKWDYTRLAFKPELVGATAIGDHIRSLLSKGGAAVPTPEPETEKEDKPQTLPPVPAGAVGRVTSIELNVRRSPNGEIRGTIPKGTELEIIGNEGSWLEVLTPHGKKNGYSVWVARSHVEILDGPPAEGPTQAHPIRQYIATQRKALDELEAKLDAGDFQ